MNSQNSDNKVNLSEVKESELILPKTTFFAANQANGFFALPAEVQIMILQMLGPGNTALNQSVSKQWQHLLINHEIFRRQLKNDFAYILPAKAKNAIQVYGRLLLLKNKNKNNQEKMNFYNFLIKMNSDFPPIYFTKKIAKKRITIY